MGGRAMATRRADLRLLRDHGWRWFKAVDAKTGELK